MAKEADKEEIREETHEFQDSEQEELEEEGRGRGREGRRSLTKTS